MSNLEFIESLQALGWSEALAAHRLGVTTRTIARWKKGGTPRGIPKTVALTIRAYLNQVRHR